MAYSYKVMVNGKEEFYTKSLLQAKSKFNMLKKEGKNPTILRYTYELGRDLYNNMGKSILFTIQSYDANDDTNHRLFESTYNEDKVMQIAKRMSKKLVGNEEVCIEFLIIEKEETVDSGIYGYTNG